MDLRLSESSVRLRLTKAEIETLGAEGRVEARVQLAPDQALIYALVASNEVAALRVLWQPGTLIMMMPAAAARAWARSGQIGFTGMQAAGGGELALSVEWDFKESARGDDEAARRQQRYQALDADEAGLDDRPGLRHEPSD